MKKGFRLILLSIITVTILSSSFIVLAKQDDVELTVIELRYDESSKTVYTSSADDSKDNPDYKPLGYHWDSTINLYVNPSNKYGFASASVIGTITTSANTWDAETDYPVFTYGTTTKTAGKLDGTNVVSWGSYKNGVIAVTYIWYIKATGHMVETDCTMNTRYKWSLTGEANKMDVQNIMTHEFGHFCGLADLYDNTDYWLTMYGWSGYGITYQRTLGLGDMNGLWSVYGK